MQSDSKRPKSSTNEEICIYIELGHNAIPRAKVTDHGYTHDWTVFVRGLDGVRLEDVVERVIFNLHQDFPKPKRTIKSPPYEVSETGYAGFEVPIDMYFKSDDPKQSIRFMYDIQLDVTNPVKNIRRERVTFLNPSPDFKRRLLRAGAQSSETIKLESTYSGTPPRKEGSRPPSSASAHSQNGSSLSRVKSVSTSHLSNANGSKSSAKNNGGSNSSKVISAGKSILDKSASSVVALPAPPPLHPANGSHSSGAGAAPPPPPPLQQQNSFMDMFGPPIQTSQKTSEKQSISKDHDKKRKYEDRKERDAGRPHSKRDEMRIPSKAKEKKRCKKDSAATSSQLLQPPLSELPASSSPGSVESVASGSSKSPPGSSSISSPVALDKKPTWHGKVNLSDLLDLRNRINSMTDRKMLQRIVDIVDDAHGEFLITGDEWLEFDFSKLDLITINKVRKLVCCKDSSNHSVSSKGTFST